MTGSGSVKELSSLTSPGPGPAKLPTEVEERRRFADLHIHTFYSDSTSSPVEVVQEAVQRNLKCIAITDHDTVEGIEPAREAAENQNLEIVSGIELSTDIDGKDIHVLGYFFDDKNSALLEVIDAAQTARLERIKKMIEKLSGLGIKDIDFDEVCSLAKSKSVGRPHLAVILKRKKHVRDFGEAFAKYLGEDAPAYVPKYKQTPQQGIELIHRAKGLAVLAHPMVTNKDELIPSLVEAGLDGLEAYYPNYSETVHSYYLNLAKKYNLLVTGGSDAHGKAKDNTYIGKMKISYELVQKLKDKL